MAGCVGGGRNGRCGSRGAEGRAPEAAPACGERSSAREEEEGDDAMAEIVGEAADPIDSFNVAGAGSDGVGEGGGGGDGCGDGGDLDGKSSCGASTAGVPPPPLATFHTPTNLTHRGRAAGGLGAGSSQPDGGEGVRRHGGTAA
ncbi:hypothetical protein PVAP13_3KG128349 [Panicum virgatum]|uniref:Uncharacterized protein n=1 Tax=Panicum virgatum TaxID=38727 RepID=A0A8T0UXI0_PANVG|nr:hypothetical protein PVAP13_3KG128349 [Panicum virgatum]